MSATRLDSSETGPVAGSRTHAALRHMHRVDYG